MSYSVWYSEDGFKQDISDFVAGVQYSGDIQSAARKLELSVLSGTDVFIPKLEIRKGGLLTLFSEEKELMRAVVFREDRDDKGNVKVTGYTHGIYLAKNKDTHVFTRMKASQIAEKICSEFQIPTGTVEDTKEVFTSLIFREKTLWDMIVIALTETTKRTGIKYRMFFKEGKLNLCEKRTQYTSWMLEEGVNLMSANISSSIEETKNAVKVIGRNSMDSKEEGPSYTAEDAQSQKLYGVLQEVSEESGSDISQSKLRQIAENKLKELGKEQIETSVEALGIDDVEAGMAVYVKETATGLTGTYYVEQDDHTIGGNSHTMRLKLALTDEVPKLEYDNPLD